MAIGQFYSSPSTNRVIQLGNLLPDRQGMYSNPTRGRVYSPEGLSPCLTTCGGGQRETKILLPPPTIIKAAENLKQIAQSHRQCKVGITIKSDYSLRPYNMETKAKDAVSEFCTDYEGSIGSTNIATRPNNVYGESSDYRIRKLTPRECFRLMDVQDTDIDKIQASGLSKTKQYQLAGNSIVVSCLYHIFRNMFIPEFMEQTPPPSQRSLFDEM